MKKFLFVFILFPYILNGQILFEKGYIITKDGVKTECLIKNIDWENNPSSFQYKINETDDIKTGNALTINEFCVYGYSKYISAKVLIDQSPDQLNELTSEKNPKWSEELLFLRILANGKAILYSYQSTNLLRFFYSVNGSAINQLVSKKYLIDNYTVAENNLFRQQLWIDVKCDIDDAKKIIENIHYNENELIKYFNKYNNLDGSIEVENVKREPREIFNIKITPGIKYSKMSAKNSLYDYLVYEFSQFPSFTIGVEFEVFFPFNKNKWAAIIEPEFNYFKDEFKPTPDYKTNLTMNSIELPIGIRHYFFLKGGSRFFVNGFFISGFGTNLNSKIIFNDNSNIKIYSAQSFAFGAGFSSKRTSIEFRYYTPRDMLNRYVYWSSDYSRFSLIMGYKIYYKSK